MMLFASICLLPSAAEAQWVQLSNLTHPSISPSFIVGDQFELIVAGVPNQPVSVLQTTNAVTGDPYTIGTTDGNGYFVLTGTEDGSNVGNYSQIWSVGNASAASISFQVSWNPIVKFTNFTHPGIEPNFEVGDSFVIDVGGPGFSPVTIVQTQNGVTGDPVTLGYTDFNGNFEISGVQPGSNIGTYTQVWSVAWQQSTPALTFVVGQLGNGTLTTTQSGQTPDGHVSGVSMLTIQDGSVTTYSSTELDDYAAGSYDTESVSTLYQYGTLYADGSVVGGNQAAIGAGPFSATDWADYDLQTDHYVIAFFVVDVGFINPLYYGEGQCNEDESDCTIGSGGGEYIVVAAEIYLGSTLADQTNIPQDGSTPPFDQSLYDNFLASSQGPYPSGVTFTSNVKAWRDQLIALATLISLAKAQRNTDVDVHPVPFMIDLLPTPEPDRNYDDGDVYHPYPRSTQLNGLARYRSYLLRDAFGHPWDRNLPVIVRERFSDPVGPGTLPAADGVWSNLYPALPADGALKNGNEMTDHYALADLLEREVGFIQYYSATGFNAPLALDFGSFIVPGQGLEVPLWIRDVYNSCLASLGSATLNAGQLVRLTSNYSGIDGDNGPPPAKGCASSR